MRNNHSEMCVQILGIDSKTVMSNGDNRFCYDHSCLALILLTYFKNTCLLLRNKAKIK